MHKVVYTNDSSDTVYIGGVMIPAGGSRLVDALLLPKEETKESQEDGEDPQLSMQDERINQLLDLSVENIKIELLSIDDIEFLKLVAQRESEAKDRLGVKDAVTSRILLLSQPD